MVEILEENSIEEDIEILKELEEEYDYAFGAKIYKPHSLSIKEIKAIKHVLSDYKRVLKENEELKAKLEYKQYGDLDNTEFEKYINDIVGTKTKELKEQLEENSILKDKIEKILDETEITDFNSLVETFLKINKLIEGE